VTQQELEAWMEKKKKKHQEDLAALKNDADLFNNSEMLQMEVEQVTKKHNDQMEIAKKQWEANEERLRRKAEVEANMALSKQETLATAAPHLKLKLEKSNKEQ
jgi:hypothetical protein